METIAFSQKIRALYKTGICLTHGDLTTENVFVLPDGLRVIDWQRPLLAPVGIDWVTFLHSAGLDPRRHAPPAVVQMRLLLLIHWLSEATRQWFPPGAETYDRQIAEIAENLSTIR